MRDSPPDSRAAVCSMRAASSSFLRVCVCLCVFGSCAGCLSAGSPPAARLHGNAAAVAERAGNFRFILFIYLFCFVLFFFFFNPKQAQRVTLNNSSHKAHTHATCVKMKVFNGFGAEDVLQNDGGTSALQRARGAHLRGIIALDIPLMLRQRPAASSLTAPALTGPCPGVHLDTLAAEGSGAQQRCDVQASNTT